MRPPSAPSRPPKICHIAATTEGAVWVFEQLRDLRDLHGYDVAAILNGDRGALVDRFRAAGIPVHVADFDFTSSLDLLALPRKVIALVKLLRRERFDLVQTHLFHSMVIGRIASWFADVPVRLSMIAGPFHLEAHTPRWIDRFTCWTDTTIIASCEFTRALYRQMRVSKKRLAVIYYGPDEAKFDPSLTVPADLRAEFGWAADTPLVAMVAYFYPELPVNRWIPPVVQGRSVKSQEDLIRAAPFVLREFPQAKFVFVGSGWEEGGRAYLQRMRALATDLGLAGSVMFTGYRADIPSVLRAVDVAVQPSLSENLGGTIESLLMEAPTVATRVGGMTDSVVDGETGVLVRPADPRSLADGILRLLRDPSAARAYGVAGRERMLARFTLRHTVDDLDTLYQRLLSRRTSGYRAPVVYVRLVVGATLCLAIVLRYCVVDVWLLRHWDQGWRPWRGNPLRIIPVRTWLHRLYAVVGRYPTNFGIRRRIAAMLATRGTRTSHYITIPIGSVAAACAAMAAVLAPSRRVVRWLPWRGNMLLYRLYAWIGRHPTDFGIRRRIAAMLAGRGTRTRRRNIIPAGSVVAACAAVAAVLAPSRRVVRWLPWHGNMLLYRFYAWVGRHPTNFGIRRRIRARFDRTIKRQAKRRQGRFDHLE
jgi:glycosyltransferase involved in cell wall biosynthesis